MHAGHRDVGGVAAGVEAVPVVAVTGASDAVVAGVAVRGNDAGRFDQLLDRRQQAVAARAWDAGEANSTHAAAALLDRDQHHRLPFCSTTVFARRDAADVRLVDLDLAGELVAARTHHRPPELVQPRPRRFVGAELERPLQPKRADTALLVGDLPGGREPERKRRARAGEDRARRRRGAPVTRATAQQAIAHPPAVGTSAGRAGEPSGQRNRSK